jgi:hypothetical protein
MDQCPLSHGIRRFSWSTLPSPRIASLLRNNNCPDDAEFFECRRVVAEGKDDLAGLDDEIAQATAHLHHLKEERLVAREMISAHEFVLQSPRRLNVDILSEIFRIACDTDQPLEEEHAHSLDVRRAQWRLGQVSSTWRHVVTTNIPSIWTDVKLCITADLAHAPNYLMDQALRRTAGLKLRVQLHFLHEEELGTFACSLLGQLFPTCDRWYAFCLHTEGPKVLQNASIPWTILKRNLPALHLFSYQLNCSGSTPIHEDLLSAIGSATSIRTVIASGWLSKRVLPVSPVNVQNLIWYSWNPSRMLHYNGGASESMLCELGNLETCRVDAVYKTKPSKAEIRPICLRSLHSLHLNSLIRAKHLEESKEAISGEVERLLNIFKFPSLTSLTITGKLWSTKPLTDFLVRSGCALENLKMPFIDDDSTHSVLHHTPYLRKFTLEFPEQVEFNLILKTKIKTEESQEMYAVCSSLERLIFEYSPTSFSEMRASEATELAEMIKNRQARIKGRDGRLIALPFRIEDAAREIMTSEDLQSQMRTGFELLCTPTIVEKDPSFHI